MKNSSIMVRMMMTTIINRLVAFSVPTKSSIGVTVITCQGWPKPSGKFGERCDQILSVCRGLEHETVGIGAGALLRGLAQVRIVDIGQGRDLELPVLHAHALVLVRKGDDRAVVTVGDQSGAAQAGPVLVEKARQHVHGDVGGCTADEIHTMEYWNAQRENRETGVGIDCRFGHRER